MKLARDHDTISAPNLDGPSAIRADAVVALRCTRTREVMRLAPAQMRFTVGGAGEADLVIDDPYVSAQHCALERRGPNRLLVRDLGSKNGTTVDRNRVEVADLRPGSRLGLGRTELVALGERALSKRSTLDALIGEHPRFRRSLDLAVRAGAAASECSVLILGETGTGKELFARVVHEASRRAAGPFAAVNCGALNTELLGSELFGHTRGAFTGATENRPGLFFHASGGTVFLDELGELPREQQPHLLRVLETKRLRPIGGHAERAVDVRFVAATNRLDAVGEGLLREDLYHRIATVIVDIPPLRQRKSDIPLLVAELLAQIGEGDRVIAPATMNALIDHDWPGNVRELRCAVQRAATLCPDELTLDALLPGSGAPRPEPEPAPASMPEPASDRGDWRDDTSYDDRVRVVMREAIARYGSLRRAARALGVPKSTFSDRARRLGLKASKTG